MIFVDLSEFIDLSTISESIFLYRDLYKPLSSINSPWVPASTTDPLSITNILSAFSIVLSL